MKTVLINPKQVFSFLLHNLQFILMSKIMLLALIVICLMTSCGQSAQEKAAAEKALIDSVQKATANKMQEKQDLQKNLADLQQQSVVIKNRLEVYRANLVAENEKMKQVKEPQLSRLLSSDEEKNREIAQQALVIQKLQDAITDLETTKQQTAQKINQIQAELNTY